MIRTNTTALRIGAASMIGISAVAIGMNGVFASLNATASNVTPQSLGSGTLSLSLGAANGSAGFGDQISNLPPGDVVNRYVDITNDGTLDSIDLDLGIAATGTSSLISDGATSRALTVSVNSCSVPWDVNTGTCSADSSTEIAAAPLSTFATAQDFAATTGLTSGQTSYLQVSLALPDQNETTVNGVAPEGTVQGGTVDLTYTFGEIQRNATATNG